MKIRSGGAIDVAELIIAPHDASAREPTAVSSRGKCHHLQCYKSSN